MRYLKSLEFKKILESKEFEGRDNNMIKLIDELIEYIIGVVEEHKEFFHGTLPDFIDEELDYFSDLQNGELSNFYRLDIKDMNYEKLRDYVFNNYNVNIDNMDSIYLDCLWVKHLTTQLLKNVHNASIKINN